MQQRPHPQRSFQQLLDGIVNPAVGLLLAPLCWLIVVDPVSTSSPSPSPTLLLALLCFDNGHVVAVLQILALRAAHGRVACRRVASAGPGPTHAQGDRGGDTGGGELGVTGGGRSAEVEVTSRWRRRTARRRGKSRRGDGRRQSSTSV
jgi:hypothetical protein